MFCWSLCVLKLFSSEWYGGVQGVDPLTYLRLRVIRLPSYSHWWGASGHQICDYSFLCTCLSELSLRCMQCLLSVQHSHSAHPPAQVPFALGYNWLNICSLTCVWDIWGGGSQWSQWGVCSLASCHCRSVLNNKFHVHMEPGQCLSSHVGWQNEIPLPCWSACWGNHCLIKTATGFEVPKGWGLRAGLREGSQVFCRAAWFTY